MQPIRLDLIDGAILIIYFGFVLGIGFVLKRHMRTSSDFFLSGRLIPTWVAGLAFLSANLGAQEVIGMAASGAKYGIMTSHLYWVGAIPAMVFVAVFMMPFYYGSKARSVPEYLKMRFDEKTRALNAISFAVMTVFSSGISMYAMALLLNLILGWDFHVSVWLSAIIVLVYISLGGLTSAIYNEVMQFFLIVAGFAPLVFLGLRDVGGWSGLQARLADVATAQGFAPGAFTHSWKFMGAASANPMGVEWFGMLMGLGFVLSFGYWCTDFLVMQRAMAAESMAAAERSMMSSDRSVCAPLPRRSTRPGFGVNSASAVNACRARRASRRAAAVSFEGFHGVARVAALADSGIMATNSESVRVDCRGPRTRQRDPVCCVRPTASASPPGDEPRCLRDTPPLPSF